MKKITISFLLFSSFLFSQNRFGMSVGESIYKDKLGTSRSSTTVSIDYRYMFNEHIGIQTVGQMDVIRSWENYDQDGYRAYGMSARLEIYKPIIRSNKFHLAGTLGYGGMYIWFKSYDRERIQFTSTGITILYPLRSRNSDWGALKSSFNYFYNWGQDTTLNGLYEENNSEFFNINLGFIIYLDFFRGRSDDFK